MLPNNPPPLPPGWQTGVHTSFVWVDPKRDAGYDISLTKLDVWYVRYWVWATKEWREADLPLTPDPPFELAEALYYAAQ